MDSAFISSVQRDYGDVRQAAARAAEAYGLRVFMAEGAPAGGTPKGALLGLVRQADVFILILGPRYGDSAPGQTSPTEDEFDEAGRIGLPLIVLVQACDREPRQEEFLRRVRGSWGDSNSNLTATFTSVENIGMQLMAALRSLEQQADARATRPRAEQRAVELAHGPDRGAFSGANAARVAYAPLVEGRILADLVLNRGDAAESASAALRDTGLVPQQLGIEASVSGSGGLQLVARGPGSAGFGLDAVDVMIGLDGAVVVEAPVTGTGPFGSSLVDPDRLAQLVTRSGAFTGRVWSLFDASSRISQLVAAVGVPAAQQRVFGRTQESRLTIGSTGRLPTILIAPQPPAIARRGELAGQRLGQVLLAAVGRNFRDAQAIVGI